MLTFSAMRLRMPFGMGHVNCFLIEQTGNYLLIDTGVSSARRALLSSVESAGCTPGELKAILLTHGDFDHSGNAAYLSQKYQVPVGMHASDAGMVERGDMFVNRQAPNPLLRKLIPLFTGFGRQERFTPTWLLDDGEKLDRIGFDARILSLPGHSAGSIGILTSSGDLFCGDLFENIKSPQLNSIMDDRVAADKSRSIILDLPVTTIHPGHGSPFPIVSLT